MNTVVLLSGSNIGDRLKNITTAKKLLLAADCFLQKESSVYVTAAWGKTRQAAFLNQAWWVYTEKNPHDLLVSILHIEKKMGRQQELKWEPRIIDIDILFFNELIHSSDDLVIPHPHLHERRFALAPVAEILPLWVHPVFQKTATTLLKEVKDPLIVEKFVYV